MIDLIRKIVPDTSSNNPQKLGSLLTMRNGLIAYVAGLFHIEVLEYERKDKKCISLKYGHQEQIKCLKFSQKNSDIDESLLLCSCSIDHVLIWNISDLLKTGSGKAKILKRCLEFEPNQCAFHPKNNQVAICYGDHMTILEIDVIILLNEFNIPEFCIISI